MLVVIKLCGGYNLALKKVEQKPGRRSLASLVNHPISVSIGIKWELCTLLFAACILRIADILLLGRCGSMIVHVYSGTSLKGHL